MKQANTESYYERLLKASSEAQKAHPRSYTALDARTFEECARGGSIAAFNTQLQKVDHRKELLFVFPKRSKKIVTVTLS